MKINFNIFVWTPNWLLQYFAIALTIDDSILAISTKNLGKWFLQLNFFTHVQESENYLIFWLPYSIRLTKKVGLT